MISDVLSDAIEEIKRYQRDFRCYDGMEKEIGDVIRVMDRLRAHLDDPTGANPPPPLLANVTPGVN